MSINKLLFGLLCVFLISTGQILFKISSRTINFSGFTDLVKSMVCNYVFIVSIVTYFVATLFWIKLLKDVDLRIAYPLMSLAFIIVPILSNIFLSEKITLNTIIGGGIILIGVAVSFR